MRHLYTLLFGLLITSLGMAQSGDQVKIYKKEAVKRSAVRSAGEEIPTNYPTESKNLKRTKLGMNKSATYWETIIGLTVYDLQTNASVQNRLAQTGVELSAAFTISQQSDVYSDRGTGYNFGYSDVNEWDDEDFERIESERVGWPSIIQTGGGKEIAITHQSSGDLWMAYRETAGTGSWEETTIGGDAGISYLWPRAVAGGEDGNSIHLICVSTPTANDGEIYEGFDGALLYFRSTDSGETWDITDSILPGIDSTIWHGFDGDSYAIHARGNKVAFGLFNDFGDSFVMISEDNGDTWEYTSLVDFPVDDYSFDSEIIDIDGDELADTLYNTDGSGAIHIDEDLMTHVTFGNMFYLDDVSGDDQFSYFPYTDGLEYWNETLGADTSITIAVTMDMNDDGVVTLDEDIGLYYTSLTGMSQIATDEDGNLYVSYCGVTESHFSGSQLYRHVFLLSSEDGGENWSTPVDATPDVDYLGYESVFASMAPMVDDYIHLIYMRDFEPGLHVRGDEDFPASDNDIVYYRITPDLVVEPFVGIEELDSDDIEVYPNPVTDVLQISTGQVQVDRIAVYDMTGKLVLSEQPFAQVHFLNTSSLNSGMYILQIEQNGLLLHKNIIKQ